MMKEGILSGQRWKEWPGDRADLDKISLVYAEGFCRLTVKNQWLQTKPYKQVKSVSEVSQE